MYGGMEEDKEKERGREREEEGESEQDRDSGPPRPRSWSHYLVLETILSVCIAKSWEIFQERLLNEVRGWTLDPVGEGVFSGRPYSAGPLRARPCIGFKD